MPMASAIPMVLLLPLVTSFRTIVSLCGTCQSKLLALSGPDLMAARHLSCWHISAKLPSAAPCCGMACGSMIDGTVQSYNFATLLVLREVQVKKLWRG